MSATSTCTVNGREVAFTPGMTVLQVCEEAGVEIPRFCYHDRLSIAGNCRMCLVEVSPGPPKPAASCALPAAPGMEIRTDSEMVEKARRGVMEFLLINHPLDCPICDQGGECDLQDQAMAYGRGIGRHVEDKRAVTDKYMGPLIKTHMTRCIHCTRCVRFCAEVAGAPEIGLLGRGESAEISSLERAVGSELSANVIDLCPVGALTSAPYAFHARPWELKKTESIDVMDALGSAIRVDARGNEVMRILPRLNEAVNEEWISDKARFACDGLKRQRLDRPYVRDADGALRPVAWDDALAAVADALRGVPGGQVAAIAGDQADVESVWSLKRLMGALGSPHTDCRQDGARVGRGPRASWLFNATVEGIDRVDALLLVGTDPRREAPVLNARVRRRWLAGGFPVGLVGAPRDLTYDCEHLGDGPETLRRLRAGDHPFAAALSAAERPMMIVGAGAVARPDGDAVLADARALAEAVGVVRDGWNGFSMLHRAAGRVGALDVGFVPDVAPDGAEGRDVAGILTGAAAGAVKVVWLLDADEVDVSALKDAFVIYQGHHGDAAAHVADVILPGAAYTEKDATYVNTEGRPQRTRRAVFPPGEAREDWAIIRAASARLGHALPWDTLDALRAALAEAVPHMADVGRVTPAPWGDFGAEGPVSDDPFASSIDVYHMTCAISRASETMAQCVRAAGDGAAEARANG